MVGKGTLSPLGGSRGRTRPARRAPGGGGDSLGLRAVQEQRKQEDEHRTDNPSRNQEDSLVGCRKCSCFETMTLRTINFNDLASSKFPGQQWNEVPIADQVELLREALKARVYVIDPHSVYMRFWDLILVMCLVYTALVTPYEIAFIPPGDPGLMVINRLVDFIFIKDMVMQFFMKVERNTRQGKIWVRDRWKVAKIYVNSWFWIDLASVLPYDDFTDTLQADGIHSVKILRTIRVLRLVKLLRILKASRMVKRWENRIALKSTSLYLIKFSVLIVLSCHWMACVWGFLGPLEGTMLRCREELSSDDPLVVASPDAFYFFADREGVEQHDPPNWVGDSWVVRWAQGRTPNSPANPCDTGMVYTAALYWSVMTMTSVGYGDILPYTQAEYLICTTCMLISSIVWAYIIGAACAVMSKMDPELSEFERRIDDFNSMAQDQDLPQHIRWRGREYIREQRFHTHYMRNIDAWEGLGTDLRGTVARQVASHYINHIWFFKGTNVQFREDCAKHFAPSFFERREVIELRAKLCVVERGAVGRLGRILVPWGYWGEDMLIRMPMIRQDPSAMALTYTEIMTLSRDALSQILIDFPEEQIRFRRAAALMALFAITKIYRMEKHSGERDASNIWIHNVFDTGYKLSSGELMAEEAEAMCVKWKTSSNAWRERMEEEEQAPAPLGEMKLSTDQKIDLMAKDVISTGEALTSTHPSAYHHGHHHEGPPSREVISRLERIEQQLERLTTSLGSCTCKQAGTGQLVDLSQRGPDQMQVALQQMSAFIQERNSPGALRMPGGDFGALSDCCSVSPGKPQKLPRAPKTGPSKESQQGEQNVSRV